jgi:hypothetical protein
MINGRHCVALHPQWVRESMSRGWFDGGILLFIGSGFRARSNSPSMTYEERPQVQSGRVEAEMETIWI